MAVLQVAEVHIMDLAGNKDNINSIEAAYGCRKKRKGGSMYE